MILFMQIHYNYNIFNNNNICILFVKNTRTYVVEQVLKVTVEEEFCTVFQQTLKQKV